MFGRIQLNCFAWLSFLSRQRVSQNAFAAKAGVNQSLVSGWAVGVSFPIHVSSNFCFFCMAQPFLEKLGTTPEFNPFPKEPEGR